jgi:signal transduction histidine kinase
MFRGEDQRTARDHPAPLRLELPLIAVVGAAAGGLIALVAVPGVRATTGASAAAAMLEGITRGVLVAVPVGIALYACRRPAHARFGRLLLVFSGLWFVASLGSSSSSLLFGVGIVGYWTAEAYLVYVVLAFPSGRLTSWVDRTLTRATAVVLATLFWPTALLVDRYPVPLPNTSCDTGCPRNPFMVVGHEPALIHGFVVPLRQFLAALIFILVAFRLAARVRAANTLMRRTLTAVLAVAIARLVLIAAGTLIRRGALHSTAEHVAMWLVALAVPAFALAFLVGLVRWQVFVTAAIRRINAQLRGMPSPQQVRDVLAEAFEDPELQIGYWLRSRRRWVTSDDLTLRAPAADSGRSLTVIRDGRRRVAAILHDATLRDEGAFIDTATSLASMALESERLKARTAGTLRELEASRARLMVAADGERRRIERDLHDGAQQRLVALRIDLELAAESAEHDNPAEATVLRGFGDEIEQALEEFRSLTHGIYPAILTDRGLADALRTAALRSPIPTTVDAIGLADYPGEVATVVYFCCLEALQNVAKHARGATMAQIVVREANSALLFSVSDDGAGFPDGTGREGAGIINMRDRLSTVGGELTVHSRLGQGTRVAGRIPSASRLTSAHARP